MKLAAALVLVCSLPAATLTEPERDLLLTQLAQSAKRFRSSIENVTEAQWKFKPAPDRWSIAECAEHVITVDKMTFLFATTQLNKIPVPSPVPDKMPDDKVLKGAADRSTRIKTPPYFEPRGIEYPDRATWLAEFDKSIAKITEYAKTTQDDMRTHVIKTDTGYRDGYQMLLTLAGHTERHAQQVDEVKADPKYPK